jgi:hypothetical protein
LHSPSPQHLQPQCLVPPHLIVHPEQSNQTSHLFKSPERTGASTARGRNHNNLLSGRASMSADGNPPQPQHVSFLNPNPANPPQLAQHQPQRVLLPNPNPPQLAQHQPQRVLLPNPNPENPPQLAQHQQQHVPFPNPNPGEFLIYLLQFCTAQTSMCFGCGNPLKQDDSIGAPPNDLVVV